MPRLIPPTPAPETLFISKGMAVNKMKTIVVIMLLLVISQQAMYGQVGNRALNTIITLHSPQIRIDSLLKIFNRQTGIEFSFNSNKISPARKLIIPMEKQTLNQW